MRSFLLKIRDLILENYQRNFLLRLLFRGRRFECPCCGSHFGWILPYGSEMRPNVLCPACGSLERHRLLVLYLRNRTRFFSDNLKVLYIAPNEVLQKIFKTCSNLDYTSGDLSSPIASIHFDIIDIPFPDNHFDCIICYHVFEHVIDDRKAMSEVYRILKPGGWSILEVPYDVHCKETIDDPSVTTPEERLKAYGHWAHVRLYGYQDYQERLKETGFTVKLDDYLCELSDEERKRFCLPEIEPLHLCTK